MFISFPKLTRFSHDWVITEKLDGSNAQVLIVNNDEAGLANVNPLSFLFSDEETGLTVMAGSRNKLLDTSKQGDHMGFAKFVQANAKDFVEKLGEGRHYGEWLGLGIQRNYGLPEKRFVLFNTARWEGKELPDRVDVVPVLAQGYFDDPGLAAKQALDLLKEEGSRYAPGFSNPEGVVMLHRPSQTLFKKTFDYDEKGKWAENQERKSV